MSQIQYAANFFCLYGPHHSCNWVVRGPSFSFSFFTKYIAIVIVCLRLKGYNMVSYLNNWFINIYIKTLQEYYHKLLKVTEKLYLPISRGKFKITHETHFTDQITSGICPIQERTLHINVLELKATFVTPAPAGKWQSNTTAMLDPVICQQKVQMPPSQDPHRLIAIQGRRLQWGGRGVKSPTSQLSSTVRRTRERLLPLAPSYCSPLTHMAVIPHSFCKLQPWGQTFLGLERTSGGSGKYSLCYIHFFV